MSVQHRNIFGDPLPSGSSGDGASGPGQTNSGDGSPNPDYSAPQSSQRMSTTWQGDPLNSHDELTSAYNQSYARHSGVETGAGSEGTNVGETDKFATATDTSGGPDTGEADEGDDGSAFGKAITTGENLVTRAVGADRGDDFGKAVG